MERPQDWEIFWKASEEVELNYHLEVEKNQALRGELNQAQIQLKALQGLLQKERESQKQSQLELARVRDALQKFAPLLSQIRKEHEKLQSLYPIQDLWAAKQLEVDRLKKSLDSLPEKHEDREAIRACVAAHNTQLDELKWILDEAEARFDEQIRRFDRFDIEVSADSILTPPSAPSSGKRRKTSKTVSEF